MDQKRYKSPIEMLYHWEKTRPNEIWLRQPIDGVMYTYTWKEAADEVRRMAAAIKAMNLPPKSKIALLSKNCAWWKFADLATMMSGHIGVPMYPNLTAESVKYVLEHSEAEVLFVGKLDSWAEMKPGLPEGIKCIEFPHYGAGEYESWDSVTAAHEPMQEDYIPDPDDWMTIIYTSGTTGTPKGVVHRFHAFGYAATNAVEHIGVDTNDRFFSYLPLCHIAERVLVEMGSLYSGGSINYAESLDTFAANLADAKPTVFLAVPRIWDKFQQGILGKMPQKKLSRLLKIPFVSGLVKKKVKQGLGLTDARLMFTGAAAIPASLMHWFDKNLDMKIQEAYAMTENCSYSHVTMKNAIRIGSVGQKLPHVDVRINPDDEEIQVKHEALMLGYYKEEEQTAEAFTEDGYLRTGDTGRIDDEGFLHITGRVKDIFKTAKGKYVAPAPIELKLSADSFVSQVCVVGSGIPQPIALVTPSEEGAKQSREVVAASLEATMNQVNSTLDKHEHVKKMVMLNEEWTVENGCLTPTMKIKRREVEKQHSTNYPGWYDQGDKVVWPH